MKRQHPIFLSIAAALMLTSIGCEENEKENNRIAELAAKQLDSQNEQSRKSHELQHEVAKGTRLLIEADGKAREQFVALQSDIQAELAEVGRQRDLLEGERQRMAASRQLDSFTAVAITNTGLLIGCLLPLVLAWYLLRQTDAVADDSIIVEAMLDDLVSDHPRLLAASAGVDPIQNDYPRLPEGDPE